MLDTIAAIATGNQKTAIGILRISGPLALTCVSRVFTPLGGSIKPRNATYGYLKDKDGNQIDSCLCITFPGPHSYTGEDSAEIHTHGSPMVLAMGLEALFACGARQALGGEFTKRAFLNGKLDLAQAEAVVDLIDSQTPGAARNAVGQLEGALSRRLAGINESIMAVVSHFQAEVDYPDEGVDPFTLEEAEQNLTDAIAKIDRLCSSYARGRVLKEGLRTALIGRPNVGKSSVLNLLVGYDRAIVTAKAGTTRDSIEETVLVGDIMLRLTDTAGIRDSSEEIEQMGIARSLEIAKESRLIFAVFDGSCPLTREDRDVIEASRDAAYRIAIVNKSDLPQAIEPEEIQKNFELVCHMSALRGEGAEELTNLVASLPMGANAGESAGEMLTNLRQAQAAREAKDSLESCLEALRSGVTPDAALCDAEAALEAIGQLTGTSVRESIVNEIFSRFCVGK